MKADYVLLALVSEKLLRITSYEYGRQLWTNVALRKEKKCARCDGSIPKGTRCFSPITNGYNRMHRLCSGCVVRMAERS